MGYQVVEQTPRRLVLRRDQGNQRFGLLFGGLALAFLAVGATGWWFLRQMEEPSDFVRIFWPTFTVVAGFLVLLGPVFVRGRERFDPLEVVFDNEAGWVVLTQDERGDCLAHIPYGEIAGFELAPRRRGGTGAARVDTVRRPRSHDAVFIRKKDGGVWDLLHTRDADRARALLHQVQEGVQLTATGSNPPPAVLPPAVQVEELGGVSTVRWRNPPGVDVAIFYLIAGLIAFVVVQLARLFTTQGANGLFVYAIFGFFGLVWLGITVTRTRQFLRDRTSIYGLTVARDELIHFATDAVGRLREEKRQPLRDFAAVVHNFTFGGRDSIHLTLLNHEQAETRQRLRAGTIDLDDFRAVFRSLRATVYLRLPGLRPVELLQLENWLQERITRRTGQHDDTR